jgi:hypothetical protein
MLKEKQENFFEEKEKDETKSLFLACYSAKEGTPNVWESILGSDVA